MALEFTASRLLIPIFGSSIYTWGSLVGVILSGLSLGYYIGGRLADRKDAGFIKFCSIIFSAGLYIIFIPSFIAPASIGVSTHIASSITQATTMSDNSSSISNYYGPYASLLSRLGNTAGNLYSLSTIGSIIGTFLTVFVLIPIFELKYIMYGLGLSLIISSSFSYFSGNDMRLCGLYCITTTYLDQSVYRIQFLTIVVTWYIKRKHHMAI